MNTPTPWKFDKYGHVCANVDSDGFATFNGSIRVKGFMLSGGEEGKANTSLIVRAVNSHQALIDALETMLYGPPDQNKALAALKLANGEA